MQSIAAAIYQERAFDRLPILADALEQAGCTNADVLLHRRQPGEHVRGCRVVVSTGGAKQRGRFAKGEIVFDFPPATPAGMAIAQDGQSFHCVRDRK